MFEYNYAFIVLYYEDKVVRNWLLYCRFLISIPQIIDRTYRRMKRRECSVEKRFKPLYQQNGQSVRFSLKKYCSVRAKIRADVVVKVPILFLSFEQTMIRRWYWYYRTCEPGTTQQPTADTTTRQRRTNQLTHIDISHYFKHILTGNLH